MKEINNKANFNSSLVGRLGGAEYINLYKQYHETIKKHSSALMNAGRDASFALFEKLGFPTTKLEKYKYTDLTDALSYDYGLNINRLSIPVNPYQVFKCDVPGIQSYLYFVLNDGFYPVNDKRNDDLPENVIICSLREASEKYPALVEKYYGKLTATKNDGLVAFNGAFAQDGFFMYVPENVQLDRPVQLINIMRSDVDFMANSHNLIILEKNAKAQLLVCDHTMDDVRFVTNRVTEVFVDEYATYEHYKLENTHNKTTNLSTLLIDQKASSNVLGNIITLHNGVTRNTIEIGINGEHCETTLCGMVVGDKNQQVDNYTSIRHNKPNCHSTELFKYVLDDVSKGGFTGELYVARDAQRCRATAARPGSTARFANRRAGHYRSLHGADPGGQGVPVCATSTGCSTGVPLSMVTGAMERPLALVCCGKGRVAQVVQFRWRGRGIRGHIAPGVAYLDGHS